MLLLYTLEYNTLLLSTTIMFNKLLRKLAKFSSLTVRWNRNTTAMSCAQHCVTKQVLPVKQLLIITSMSANLCSWLAWNVADKVHRSAIYGRSDHSRAKLFCRVLAMALCPSVRLSVCPAPVLCRKDWTNRAGFWYRVFLVSIFHCVKEIRIAPK